MPPKELLPQLKDMTNLIQLILGTGTEIKINQLVNLIAKLTGFDGKIVWETSKPDGQPRRCLDTSRAKKEFAFEAKTDLTSGLQKTIEWYKNECINNA